MNTFKSFTLLENRVQVPVLYTENVKEPLSIMECYDEYCNSIMEAEIEFERAYCKGLVAMDEDTTVLNEGIITGIIEFIQSIITGIIDFFSSLFGGGGSSSSGGSSTSSEVKTTKLYYEKFIKAKDKYVKTIQPNFNTDVTVDGKVLKTSYNTFNPENFINPKQGVAIEFKDETDQLLQFVDKIDAMVYKANLGGTPPVEEIKALEDEVNQASDVYSNYSNNASTRVEYMGSIKLKDYLDTMTEKLSSPEIKTFSEKDPSGDIPDNFKEIIDSLNGLLETCKKSDGRVSAEVTDTVKKALASVSSYTTKLISQYSTVIKARYKWVLTELSSYVKAVNSFSTSDTGVVSTNLIEEAAILSLYETNNLIKESQSLLNEDLTTLYENPFDDLDDFFNESQTMVLNEGIGFGAIKGALGIAVLLCALIIVAIKCIFSGGSSGGGGGGGSYSGGSSTPSKPSSSSQPSDSGIISKDAVDRVLKRNAERTEAFMQKSVEKMQSSFRREAAKTVSAVKQKFDLQSEKSEKVVEAVVTKVEAVIKVFTKFHTRLTLTLDSFRESVNELNNMYKILQQDPDIYNREVEVRRYFTSDTIKNLPDASTMVSRFKLDPQFRSRVENYEKSLEGTVGKIVNVLDQDKDGVGVNNYTTDQAEKVIDEEGKNIKAIVDDMKSYLSGIEIPEIITYERDKYSTTIGKYFSDILKMFSLDNVNSYREDNKIYSELKESYSWFNPVDYGYKLNYSISTFSFNRFQKFKTRRVPHTAQQVKDNVEIKAKNDIEREKLKRLNNIIDAIRNTFSDINRSIAKSLQAPLKQLRNINDYLTDDLLEFGVKVMDNIYYDKEHKVLKYVNNLEVDKPPKTIKHTYEKTEKSDGTTSTHDYGTTYPSGYENDFTESVLLDPYYPNLLDINESRTLALNEGLGALGIKGIVILALAAVGFIICMIKCIFGGGGASSGGGGGGGSSSSNSNKENKRYIDKAFDEEEDKFIKALKQLEQEEDIDFIIEKIGKLKNGIKRKSETFSTVFNSWFITADNYYDHRDKATKIFSLLQKSNLYNKEIEVKVYIQENDLNDIKYVYDFMKNTDMSTIVNKFNSLGSEGGKLLDGLSSPADKTDEELAEIVEKLKVVVDNYKSLLDEMPQFSSNLKLEETDTTMKLGDYIDSQIRMFDSDAIKTASNETVYFDFKNKCEALTFDKKVLECINWMSKSNGQNELENVVINLAKSMRSIIDGYAKYISDITDKGFNISNALSRQTIQFSNELNNIYYSDQSGELAYSKDPEFGMYDANSDDKDKYQFTTESVLLNSSSLHSIKVEQLVAEAVIFSEQITDQERYDKLASLNEAIVRKIQEWWKAGIAKIKALFAKFMEKMNRVTDANYLKKYKDIILKQPFQNRSYKSKDLFGCMNRTLSLQVPYLDYNKHADILKGENPISTFFQRELAPKMQGYAFFKPNNTGAPNTIEQLANYCKDWFMGTQEVEFNGAAVQEHIKDVYDYLMDMKKIKQSIDKSINDIEKSAANVAKIGGTGQAAKQNAEYSATGNAANDAKTTGDNGTGGQNGTPAPAQGGQPQQQAVNASANFDFTNSVYSILYELEVQNPAQQNQQPASGTNANPSASGVRHVEDGTDVDQSAAKDSMLNDVEKVCKNYVDICTTVLKAKLTAIEFTRKELREIVRIHVQDYVGKQDIGKGGEEATNTQQYQNTIANNQV